MIFDLAGFREKSPHEALIFHMSAISAPCLTSGGGRGRVLSINNKKAPNTGLKRSTPMQKLQAETPFANTDPKGEAIEEAQERLTQAVGSLVLAAAGTGM